MRSTANPDPKSADIGRDGCAVVEAIELAVFRDRVPVLLDVNLAVQPGETIAIMGPNGAGKSTLLKCLAGVLRPDDGKMAWIGESTARSRNVRRQIGYVGHECGLYRELTPLENLMFAGRMYGVERPSERAWALLEESGLEWAADRSVEKLSQGVWRRLAIARALVHQPELILLDEPFVSLDAEGRHWLERLFQGWRSQCRTVCFASHNVAQSRALADRILWLDHGRMGRDEGHDSNSPPARWSA